jgi:DNA-binding FrmR family transcriptional regulator
MSECCACKKKIRSEEERRALENRLSRLEGQIRGIRRMLDEDAYCIDIITQANAVKSALCAFEKELLASHIRSCVAEDIKCGKDEKVDELVSTLARML